MATELVCPGCRTRTPERLDLRTLERRGEILACECGRRYPIVDEIPIVMKDPAHFLRSEIAAVVERDLDPEVSALLVADGPDDAPYPRLLEHLSTYLDAHWGDRASPPPDGPGATFSREVVERIAARASVPVGLAVELGCSVGRVVAELAAGAEHVVGVELQFAAVRRARRLLTGAPLSYGRRTIGRHYATARVAAGDRAVPPGRTTLVCGDAMDPPLIPGIFERVVALNLLDSVRGPHQLLSVIDALCAPGGEIILASPYAWQSAVMPEDHRLGGADPAAALTAILEHGTGLGARYRIAEACDLPWTLRRDARSAATYCIHYIRAQKT